MTDSEKLDLILGRMQGVETGVLELGKQVEAKMDSMETKIGSIETLHRSQIASNTEVLRKIG